MLRARRSALAAVLGVVAVVGRPAPSAAAQAVQLDVVVHAAAAGEGVRVECRVVNRGEDAAYELTAELRGAGATLSAPRELREGGSIAVAWRVPRERWLADLRQVAAVRLRYRDVNHNWASVVAASGSEAAAAVRGPHWPDDLAVQIRGPAPPEARAGRVVWWSPAELAFAGDSVWRARDAEVSVAAALRPLVDVTGWETSAFALLLPDDPRTAGLVVRVPIDARSFRSLWRPNVALLAAYAGACMLGWTAWLLRGGAAPLRRRERLLRSLPVLAAVLSLGATFVALFPPALLALATTPAGGDFASHVVALRHLEAQLARGDGVVGWSHDQYGGFPLFLFYFPLAFLVMAALDVALPFAVAFKVGALAGPLLLPFAWALALRWLGAPPAARWLAPVAALAFLLVEEHAVWGGNLASVLAGEFGYGLGYALAWPAMAFAWRTRDLESPWWPVPVLLALTGLAHGYTLLVAALGILLLACHPRRWTSRWLHVGRCAVLAFGLLAWWLLPLVWNLPWTNGFRERWQIEGVVQLLPPAVWPACALLVGGGLTRALRRQRPFAAPQLWLLSLGAVMFVVYRLGYSLGVVDVRFVPPMQGALLLAGCWEAGRLLEHLRPALRGPLAAGVVLAAVAAAVAGVDYLPSWARWNFTGMERKARWPDYAGIMDRVAGEITGPRVAFEHHPEHNAAGTIRAFELLPHFARRATLEGLYFQSAPLAPPIFFLQSELSLYPSCPLPEYECGGVDTDAAARHLRLLGAETIIAYSDSISRALARDAKYRESGRSGVYRVFDLADSVALVEPARMTPVLDRSGDWRASAYDWFRAGTDLDVPLVLGGDATAGMPAIDRYRPAKLPRVPYSGRPAVRSELGPDRIRITTDAPGHPLIVKVAYHPGWRASDGSPVRLIAPGTMLVVPRSRSVTLEWSNSRVGAAGTAVTLIALLVLVLVVTGRDWRPSLPEWPRAGVVAVGSALGVAAVLTLVHVGRHPYVDAAGMLAEGQRRLEAGDYAAAERSFDRALAGETRHGLRDDAVFYLGLVAAERGDRETARRRWESFLNDVPVSRYRGETLVRLARLYTAAGEGARARAALEAAADTPLNPVHWRETALRDLRDAPPHVAGAPPADLDAERAGG